LALPLMALIGRISYSLYLWHWPVFSFVDYAWYWAPEWQRLPVKLGVSLVAATACYRFVEKPARTYLNQPRMRRLTFAALPMFLSTVVAVGLYARYTYFVSSSASATARGGVVIRADGTSGSIALAGDSNASMYGVVLRQLADELQYRFVVLSVPGAITLPRQDINHKVWLDILADVRRQRPDVLVYACNWPVASGSDTQSITQALGKLRRYTRHIILLTKPPVLPPNASREAIRNGARPPFFEDAGNKRNRLRINRFIKSLASDKITVLDVEPLFKARDGGIRLTDDRGRLLYFDSGHLSVSGARLVMPQLRRAIQKGNMP